MEKVLFQRNLCPLVLSYLDPNDQANARLVCTLWNSIIEKVIRRTEFSCVLKTVNTKERILGLNWTSCERGGENAIVEDIHMIVYQKGHQGYAKGKFNIKTRKFKPSTHWFYENGRRDHIRPKRYNKVDLILTQKNDHKHKTHLIIQIDDPVSIHKSLHKLEKTDGIVVDRSFVLSHINKK